MPAPTVWCFSDAPADLRAYFTVQDDEAWLARWSPPPEDTRRAATSLSASLKSSVERVEGYLTPDGLVVCGRYATQDEFLL